MCNEKEIDLLPSKPTTTTPKNCVVKSAEHSQTAFYELNYNTLNRPIGILGFADFDVIEYKGDLPVKAINTLDKSYHLDFTYDSKSALTAISFFGKDAVGLPFEYKSKVYQNTKQQIERVDLAFPVFTDNLTLRMEYDTKGNLKKISKTIGSKTSTVLENLSFDDKNSPYKNSSLSKIMMYFVLYTAIAGENNTYFINQNNALLAKVYSNLDEEISYGYKYEYNADGFPISNEVTRKQTIKSQLTTRTYKEAFTYSCK